MFYSKRVNANTKGNLTMNHLQEELSAGNGAEVRPLHDYGVGIDTHRDFIQVCVLLRQGAAIKQYESEHRTTWAGLLNAGEWIKKTINEKSIPTLNPEPLRYTIESTSTYHMPVLKALAGRPSVVNPVLAGSARRKTDVLDARLLAYQSMTGLWPESFIASRETQEFRLLMRQREYHVRQCTAISNRINNYILRFGHTLGSFKSVRSMECRALIEDMCRDDYAYEGSWGADGARFICPDGLPDAVKRLISGMYADFDAHEEKVKLYQKSALDFAKGVDWETSSGHIRGDALIKNLSTVPGVGEMTILAWLSEVVTPLRFDTVKQLCAFCGCDPTLKVSAGKVTSQVRRKGNVKMHYQLTKIAGTCINRHSEPFGKWGYAIYKKHSKGGYKKACGAVARRIASAMYYVHLHNAPFSYDKYNFFKYEVPCVGIDAMGFPNRVARVLAANGLVDSRSVTDAFLTGGVHGLKGFGAKAAQVVQAWIDHNKITGRGVDHHDE